MNERNALGDEGRLPVAVPGSRRPLSVIRAAAGPMLKKSFLSRDLVAFFLISRIVFLFAAVAAPLLVRHLNAQTIPWPDAGGWRHLFQSAWFTADSGWYETIVRAGYEHRPFSGDRQANWGFFPLYALLVRALGGTFWSGLLVSNLLAFAGLGVVHEIVERLRGEEIARRAVRLMCFYPISFVLSSYRPEGLFLFLVACAYLALMQRKYWLAGAAGLLMTATRAQGVLVCGLIGFEALRNNRYRPSPAILASLVPLGGIAIFSLYLWRITGDPLAWSHIQQIAWANHPTFPLVTLTRELSKPEILRQWGWNFAPFNLAVLFAAVAATIPLLRGATLGLGLYTLANLLFPLTAGGTAGVGRYLLPLFGVFMVWAGKPGRSAGYELLLAGFAALLGLWGALIGLGVHSATG